jgi:N-acyl-D-aspartate/D-glutamate deacylase
MAAMAAYDLVIRDGLIVDGGGGPPFEGDVAVSEGLIRAVGHLPANARGREEIDARGRIVTPGFVDLHTHYDGQVTWEERIVPSSGHGVTTVVMGNCGVGFAPCRPHQHDQLIRLMEGVEDIPEAVMAEGIPWTWESYPEYLDSVAARHYDIDLASLVPHAALRVYVMGERACRLEPATPEDRAEMASLFGEGMAAGALGFGTSRTTIHRSADGESIPTLRAAQEELRALATVLRDAGRGLMQFTTDWDDPRAVIDQFSRLASFAGRPLTFGLTQKHARPDEWRDILGWVAEANLAGVRIAPQILPRAVGHIYSHELTLNPFYTTPTYRKLAGLPFAQKLAELRKPEQRDRILGESLDPDPTNRLGLKVRLFGQVFELGDPPDYEPQAETSIAARAAREGTSPEALAYDLLLQDEGRRMLYMTSTNYHDRSLEVTRQLLLDQNTVLGLGDGGAHLGTICDASYSTFLLSYWARDRKRGERLPLPFVVKSLTQDAANLVGLCDRGRLQRGFRADINVIDFDKLSLRRPTVRRNLPAGGRGLVQLAEGYDCTVVHGQIVYRHGEATAAMPGRLVRGPQSAAR